MCITFLFASVSFPQLVVCRHDTVLLVWYGVAVQLAAVAGCHYLLVVSLCDGVWSWMVC